MAKNIMALFQYEDDFLNAAKKLKASGFSKLSLMTPIPMYETQKILGMDRSPVRHFSLIGAILGGLSGFAMATACALVFIQPMGGRPIITIPPFLVISYEMTILIGVLSTLLGFHVCSRLPAWRDEPYRQESNVDRFSILVGFDADDDPVLAEKIIREAGATEITHGEDPE